MKTSSLLTQTLIFFVPALITTLLFQINPDVTSPIEEFLFYRCGLLGIIMVVWLSRSFSISESLASVITVLLYSAIFLLLYLSLFRNSKKQMRIFCYVNIAVSVWGILTGSFYLFAAMQ